MAGSIELRSALKIELFDLLKLKALNDKEGNSISGIEELIARKTAAMEAEDVAYVEKIIADLK
ncbi:MAG: hypothetical protein FWE74_01150 [Oscillospiraceae bacterium]|nr:hypothetical protein [Oscillospiraceae bacterium]